jgi:hypothetical protein
VFVPSSRRVTPFTSRRRQVRTTSPGFARKGFVQYREQLRNVDGFREVGGGAGCEEALDLSCGGIGADTTGQIQKDDGRLVLTRQLETEAAMHGGNDLDVRVSREQSLDEPQVRQVVLDMKDSPPMVGGWWSWFVVVVEALIALERSFHHRKLNGEDAALSQSAGSQ